MKVPPWVYPQKGTVPFVFAPPVFTVPAGQVEVRIGSFTTHHNLWLRLASVAVLKYTRNIANSLRLNGPNLLDVNNMFLRTEGGQSLEHPLYAVVPPLSDVEVFFTGGAFSTNVRFRAIGWYFDPTALSE